MILPKLTLFVALIALASALSTAKKVDMVMHLTCDNTFELFVNGNSICKGTDWTTTYTCNAKVKTGDVIAIDGRDQGGPAAFIGVFNGVPTKPSDWRCKDTTNPGARWNKNNFDDSSWPQAVSHGRNDGNNIWKNYRGVRPKIPGDAQWLWTSNNENHDRVYCRYVPIKADTVSETAKKALAAHKGNHLALFAEMIKHIKSGLNDIKTEVDTEFQGITTRRNAAEDELKTRIATAKRADAAFSEATSAFDTAHRVCTKAKDSAVTADAQLKFATTSLNSRNPIIEKELAVIRHLVNKVGELRDINLQEGEDNEATRSVAFAQTRDIIDSLQTFDEEAGPLSEMIEMAREHAEFTKPILDLLKQLEAKLVAELKSLKDAKQSAEEANKKALSHRTSTCEHMDAKKDEQKTAGNALATANQRRDSAQSVFNDLQKLWESTRTKTTAAHQTYTEEMLTINSLQSCAVRAMNPVRKSCWEIKSLHPDAVSGIYKITGPDGQPLEVQCDMTSQGGGWTLAGVAIFGHRGQAGWNNEAFLNKGSSNSLTSHWHMSSDFMNSLAENGEYRANCFQSTNNYERLWKGVRNYRWTQVSSSSSSSSLDGVTAFPTSWAGHHWGLTSGNNERDAVITSHSDNQWACAGNAGPNGEGYTGRGGHSNMRIWLR